MTRKNKTTRYEYEETMNGYDIYFDRNNQKYLAVVRDEEVIPLYTHFSSSSYGELVAKLEMAKEMDDIW